MEPQNNLNQQPNNPPQTPKMPPATQNPVQNKSSIGGIIGTVIIIAIIILGGLYFWGKRVEEAKLKQNLVSDQTQEVTTTTPQEQNEAAAIKSSVSNSDDLNSIQNDLNNTNVNNLSPELNQ